MNSTERTVFEELAISSLIRMSFDTGHNAHSLWTMRGYFGTWGSQE